MEVYLILGALALGGTLTGLMVFYRGAYKRYKKLFETEQMVLVTAAKRQKQLEEMVETQYERIKELEGQIVDSADADELSDIFNDLSKREPDDHGPN
jgi:hypothetical protein